MKFLKKCLLPLILAMSFIMCISFSACEETEIAVDRKGSASVINNWSYDSSILSHTPYFGVAFKYGYEGAEIEVDKTSSEGLLLLPSYKGQKWEGVGFEPDSLPNWSQGLYKALGGEELPLKFKGDTNFEWVADTPWRDLPHDGSKVFEDYVTFVARIDGHIVGYSVVYIKNDCNNGTGKVLADVVFPKVGGRFQNISEDKLKEEIQKVIGGNSDCLGECGEYAATRNSGSASAELWNYENYQMWLNSGNGKDTLYLQGIDLLYEFKDAEIEVGNTSADGVLLIDELGEGDFGENVNALPASWGAEDFKLADHAALPMKYSGKPILQWVTKTPWWELPHDGSKVFEDYVTFIARKEGHIVGYSVVFIACDCDRGAGKVLADLTYPQIDGKYQNVSENTVRAEIQKIIDGNTLKLSDIY